MAPAGSPVAREPKRGGTFRLISLAADLPDPAAAQPGPIRSTVYEALAVWKQAEQKAVPNLASGWEQPDTSTIIFQLNPAAHWQDKAPLSGRKLTSQDWKYSYNYYNSPDPRFRWKTELANLDLSRTETPDDATLVLRQKSPSVAQLTILLTTINVLALPPEIVERDGSLEKETIGSGPFLVDSYVQNGDVQLVRNPNYWKPGLPYLDKVQFLPLKDDATARINAFLTGNLEFLDHTLSFDTVKELPKTVPVVKTGQWIWTGLRFNVTRKPFDDVRVRRALHLAIDRDAMNQIAYDGNSEPSAAVPASYGEYALPKAELLQQPGYRKPKDQDLADAKKLLEAAGVQDLALTVVSSNINRQQLAIPAETLVDQLAKIGVKVTPDIRDFPNYNSARTEGDFAVLGDVQVSGGDPDILLRQAYYTGAGRNYGKYSNQQVDSLMDKQALEIDGDKRTQIIHDVQRLLLTDVPVAVYLQDVALVGIQPYVQGVVEWIGPVGGFAHHAFGQTSWLDK